MRPLFERKVTGSLRVMRAVALGAAFMALILAASGGCSRRQGSEQSRPAMTERQRDSAIAKSRLPGAGAVGAALAGSDSAAARAARLDSLGR